MRTGCKIRSFGLIASVLIFAGCATAPRRAAPPTPAQPVPSQPSVGRIFKVIPSESLLSIFAYRGGTLARAGHNHIIASHDLAGSVHVAADIARASFELHVPVAALTVDETVLRAAQGPDFSAEVPESAKEGTRHNMLGAAVLDEEHFHEIVLTSQSLEGSGQTMLAQVQVQIRGQARTVAVRMTYEVKGDELKAQGELPLKQSDLGLAPFSAVLGALQVQDELKVRFLIRARAAP